MEQGGESVLEQVGGIRSVVHPYTAATTSRKALAKVLEKGFLHILSWQQGGKAIHT